MEELDKKIRDSKDVIEENDVNDGKRIYNIAKNNASVKAKPKPKISLGLVARFVVVTLLLVGMFVSGFIIAKTISKNNVKERIVIRNAEGSNLVVEYNEIENDNKPLTFGKFETKEELIEYLNSTKDNVKSTRKSNYSDLNEETMAEAEEPGDTNDSPNSSSSTYQTNVQVANVDEADIVKVKGNHIFYLAKERYYNSSNPNYLNMFTEVDGKLELSKQIEFKKTEEKLEEKDEYTLVKITEENPNDLFVTDNYLIVRISKVEYKAAKIPNNKNYYYSGRYDYSNICLFYIFDIESLELVNVVETCGTNVSTRLIGNTLYVINNYTDYLNNENNSFYYYPYFYIWDTIYYPYIGHIYYCDDTNEVKTYVSIYKITLDEDPNKIEVEDIHILTPTINNLYQTEKNIYLIRSYGNEVIKEEEYQLSYSKSRVVVVNIEDGLSLRGSFDVKGRINDKYWIDEKDEYIRVVTTGWENKSYYFDQKYFYKYESTVFNHLTIFKKTENGFEESSAITEGLGKPGETVRSARFNGDVVTIVTYRNTDPLYYVDISDPENPVITSSLEVTGYSIYQHPYKDNYVIGFGYETNNSRNDFKIALFDISDKQNIKQVGNPYIINSYYRTDQTSSSYIQISYSVPEFYSDPKALFVNSELGIFGFRLIGYEGHYKQYTSSGSNYYSQVSEESRFIDKYLIITIDEQSTNPIKVLELAVDYPPAYVNARYNYSTSYDYYQRLVFIGNNYYLLSRKFVNMYTLEGNEFRENGTLNLK